MTTSSRIEWFFVKDPDNGLEVLGLESWPCESRMTLSGLDMRKPLPLKAFEYDFNRVNVELQRLDEPKLERVELTGGRLYTGPCFVKYVNAAHLPSRPHAWMRICMCPCPKLDRL